MAKTTSARTVQIMTALMYDYPQSIAEIAVRSGCAQGYVAQVLNDNLASIIVSRSINGTHNIFRLNPAKEITRKLVLVHDGPKKTNAGKRYNFGKGTVAIRNGISIPLDGVPKVAFKAAMVGLDDMLIQYPLHRRN
jgi:hypothetical protein